MSQPSDEIPPDHKLPVDVWISSRFRFRKGVSLAVFVDAARRWFNQAQQLDTLQQQLKTMENANEDHSDRDIHGSRTGPGEYPERRV